MLILLVLFSRKSKPNLVFNDEEEDGNDVLELKEKLDACKLDSSPDQSAGKCYMLIFVFPFFFFIKSIAREQNTVMYIDRIFQC